MWVEHSGLRVPARQTSIQLLVHCFTLQPGHDELAPAPRVACGHEEHLRLERERFRQPSAPKRQWPVHTLGAGEPFAVCAQPQLRLRPSRRHHVGQKLPRHFRVWVEHSALRVPTRPSSI